jgi:hypothetical protein
MTLQVVGLRQKEAYNAVQGWRFIEMALRFARG